MKGVGRLGGTCSTGMRRLFTNVTCLFLQLLVCVFSRGGIVSPFPDLVLILYVILYAKQIGSVRSVSKWLTFFFLSVPYAVQRLFPAGLSGSAVLFTGRVARGPQQGVQEALPRATGTLQPIVSVWVSCVLSSLDSIATVASCLKFVCLS